MLTLSRKHTVFKTLKFFKETQSVTLVAPMQSGKTTTYFQIAIAALEKKTIEKVVIFSGNRETMLRDQTLERVEKNDILKSVTTVVWGPDLKNYKPDLFVKTLYIWDESHYGQSDDQEVDKFCAKCGICPYGMDSFQGVFCLSVSATPFSEVIDVKEHITNKRVIFQKPPKSYFGIQDMLNNIHSFNDYSVKMNELVCSLSKSEVPKIGIFRLREDGKGENKLTTLTSICLTYNIPFKLYDKDICDVDLTTAIETKPTSSHIIVVKGKLKMGKTIKDKRNVLFCMETAKKSNADTLLQGLMGRFCGYDDPSKGIFLNKEIKFYIHEVNINGPTEYVNYFKTLGKTSPKSGMNLIHKKTSNTYAPLIKTSLLNRSNVSEILSSLNISVIDKIIEIKGYRFLSVGKMVLKENEVPVIEAGHGAKFEKELNIYNVGDCSYVLYAVSSKPDDLVTTTKREIFSKRLKNLYQNGHIIGGPNIMAYIYVDEMMTDIYKLIRASLLTEGLIERKIQNNEGVKLSVSVFEALKPNGLIYEKMKCLENVIVEMGEVLTKDNEYVNVRYISW